MAALSKILRSAGGNRLSWWCPGCDAVHQISKDRWGWNGNVDKPTFTPSVLCTWEEPSDDPEKFDDDAHNTKHVCHSFVVDGQMQFLGDCTHALAGQTVPIPEWPRPEWNDGD